MSTIAWNQVAANSPRETATFFDCVILVAVFLGFAFRQAAASDEVRFRMAIERVHRHRPSTSAMRKVAEKLANPQRVAQAGDIEILRVAQVVLDLETDSFSDLLSSVRSSIESNLRGASEDLRHKYDALVGVESNRVLAEATADPSVGRFRQICRRFFLTSAGYAASERLVALWLDSGEYGLAARLADQVLAEPAHQQRISPQFHKLAASLKQIGGDDWQLGASNAAGGEIAAAFYRRFQKHRDSLVPLESGWMLLGGNPSRSRIVRGSAPVPAASWSTDFFPDQSANQVQDFLKDWEGSRKEVDQPCCPASYPIVVDGNLIFRDSVGLRSVDVVHGKTNWTFRCNYNSIEASGTRSPVVPPRRASSWIPASQNEFGENSLMGAISSDGQLVFAVDTSVSAEGDSAPADLGTGSFARPFRTRLVALHAKSGPQGGRVAWVHDGQVPEQSKKPANPTRFSFLGPPLPGTSELLCLTERDQEVHLTALDPRSGVLLWSQPLCTIDRIEQFDLERHERACLPARADGIVVCPTNTGLLVAVDQARTNLLWAAFVDDLPDPKRPQPRGSVRTPPLGYASFASHLMISGGRVVYLSPHSSQLHCLDLATGRFLWSVARGDAEFVGTMSNGRVLMVGRQTCRSLSAEDGHELWSVNTGPPVGRGIAIGNRYSLPLEEGRLASLDLATGRDHGTKVLRSAIPLGHLVADRDRVYSLGARGLVAFPQVDHVLASANSATSDRQIMLAEVAAVQGNLGDAERQLRAVLAGVLSVHDRQRARRSLKEILFARIADERDITSGDYGLLNQLLETPAEQFRFVTTVSSSERPSLGKPMIEQLAERAYSLSPQVSGSFVPDNREWIISPTVWCRLQMKNDILGSFGDCIRRLRNDRRPRLRENEPTEEIARYIRIFDGEPNVQPARSYLASRFAAAGSVHSAEMLWLRNKSGTKPEVEAEATLRLMEVWEKSGLINDAIRQLDLLATDFADTVLPDGMTGARYVRRLDSLRPAKRAWQQSREPAWPVNHVEIHQFAAPFGFVQRMQPVPGSDSLGFQPDRINLATLGRAFSIGPSVDFVLPPTAFEEPQAVWVFDQRTKLQLGSLSIPFSNRLPIADKLQSGGHLVPFGVPGGLIGVSAAQLGDGEPAWTQYPADLAGMRTPVSPGPSGAEFSSFVWRNRLYVVDPLDGTLLWRRLTREPSHNLRLEVIGDRHALAVLSEDRTSFDVFETSTGRKMSTVRPGFTPNQWQGSFGHHIAGFVETPEGRRLQIRDLLKDAPEVSEVVSETSRQPMILPGGELLYLGPGGEMKIFDMAQCRKKLSVQLEAAELLSPINLIRVLSDRQRYFVNMQRHTPTAKVMHNNQAIINSPIPGLPARDDIYAFDRTTGELLWKRSIPYRTILSFPECKIPFLVTVSQVIDRANNSLQTLTVEVIDSSTGATIGIRENLQRDDLLMAHYDGEAGRIVITGQATDIELRFGEAEGQVQAKR